MQIDGREMVSDRREEESAAELQGISTLRMKGTRAMPADGDFGNGGA